MELFLAPGLFKYITNKESEISNWRIWVNNTNRDVDNRNEAELLISALCKHRYPLVSQLSVHSLTTYTCARAQSNFL